MSWGSSGEQGQVRQNAGHSVITGKAGPAWASW